MKNLIRSSLLRKTLLIFCAASAIVYALYISVIVVSRNELSERVAEVATAEILLARSQLQDRFERTREEVFELTNSAQLQQVSGNPEHLARWDLTFMLCDVQSELSTLRRTVEYLDGIECYLPKLDLRVYLEAGNLRFGRLDFPDYVAMLDALDGANLPIQLAEDSVVIHVPPVFSYGTYRGSHIPYFWIVLSISSERIQTDLERYISTQGGFYALESSRDATPLVLSGDVVSAAWDIAHSAEATSMPAGDLVHRIAWNDGILLAADIPDFDLRLVYAIPRSTVQYAIFQYHIWFVIVSVLAVALVAVLSVAVRTLYVRPLNRLIGAFRRMEEGDFTGQLEPDHHDEFDSLFRSFNRMVSKTNDLVHRVYEQSLRLQQSELKQLQYQISPHFLYNSLYLIYRMSRVSDHEGVELMSRHLSGYYEYLTESGNEWVTFAREIEHVTDYLRIQETRFENALSVKIDPIPEDSGSIRVPRLIIQPVVENAFVHGFSRGEGTVHVHARVDDSRLIVSVEDSGTRTTDDDLRTLQRILADGHDGAARMSGLRNVQRRLTLVYGSAGGIRAERSDLGGVRIELQIPAEASQCTR